MNPTVINDVNRVAAYLAQNLNTPKATKNEEQTAIILVGSAILPTMRAVFDYLADIDIAPTSPITLVLCGGIGHSTPLLRTSICKAYPDMKKDEVDGLPEARIFEKAMRMAWPELCERIDRGEIGLLVEEESTNCGANANLAVDLMSKSGITPDRVIIVQDPTMMRRTIASFEKTYESHHSHSIPHVRSWSTFTPRLTGRQDEAEWDITDFYDKNASVDELWTMDRFLELIIGEVSRMNDDEDGYGPKGKGFIGHVDVPKEVLESWVRLKEIVGKGREAQS